MMFDTTMLSVWLAVFAGALIQGTTGMGFALIVVPVLALAAPAMLPGALLIAMLPLNAYVAWRERHAIDLRGAKWISAGRLAGTFGGLWVLVAVPMAWLNALVGGSTILAALVSLVAPAFTPGRLTFASTGLITGVTETATGVGGPPLALAYQHAPVATLRATVALCFLVGEVISLIVLAVGERLGAPQWHYALGMLPVLVAGMWASHLVHRRINQRALRIGVLVFALVSGLVVLVRG
ncbi:sulfite exporter TauE/SafE family protein [Cupriavidus gilardii]|nr:sulfite exporter TauE/SafE family protein [Cupriavidus gilardii]NSX04698.1 sulfite exporter TauE/SafE family protein [Cupriavidus gilardii]